MYKYVKRAVDIVLALLLLIFASIPMLIVAIASILVGIISLTFMMQMM